MVTYLRERRFGEGGEAGREAHIICWSGSAACEKRKTYGETNARREVEPAGSDKR